MIGLSYQTLSMPRLFASSMSDFLGQFLSRLRGGTTSPGQPLVKEPLVRSDSYQTAYEKWLAAEEGASILSEVHESLSRRVAGLHSPINAFVVENPGYSGFYFTLDDQFEGVNSDFLLDFFRDRVLGLEYHLYTSSRSHFDKGKRVEQTDRHYLKPNYSNQLQPPLDQHFGNLNLEKISVDGKPSYLKVMATTYNDANYQPPRAFSGLIDHLLGSEPKK